MCSEVVYGSGQGVVAGCCEHGNKTLGSTGGGERLHCLSSTYQDISVTWLVNCYVLFHHYVG
jgi:hypothetical protein